MKVLRSMGVGKSSQEPAKEIGNVEEGYKAGRDGVGGEHVWDQGPETTIIGAGNEEGEAGAEELEKLFWWWRCRFYFDGVFGENWWCFDGAFRLLLPLLELHDNI